MAMITPSNNLLKVLLETQNISLGTIPNIEDHWSWTKQGTRESASGFGSAIQAYAHAVRANTLNLPYPEDDGTISGSWAKTILESQLTQLPLAQAILELNPMSQAWKRVDLLPVLKGRDSSYEALMPKREKGYS